MTKKINYGKILVVIFITVLIWVWADLAVNEKLSVPNATLTVAKSINPNLWVTFNNESSASIDNLILEGPASRIADARRKLNEGSISLKFFLVPQQHGIVKPGIYTIDVPDIIKEGDQIKQLGLTAASCKPDKLTVNAVELVKKSLAVKCVDEDRNPVKTAAIEPAQVDALVPADWSGEKLTAKVSLLRREIGLARQIPIEKKPYLELAPGQIREITALVKITTPPEEDMLKPDTIKNTTLGFNLSALLQGKYKVEITNLNEVLSPIAIRATPEAKHAYENMRYQVILEIDDTDKETASTEPLRKELIYNFPPEYVRRNEIALNQQPVVSRFKLIPIATVAPAPMPAD